ncbi:MAG: thioredoxin family protein [Proteobacteria bacterium]|nr:thioredoxin family protein [Pseudomonadota bacterium]
MLQKTLTLTLILLFAIMATPVVADEYSEAIKKAKAEDKPVVIYFYSKYCRYCDAMDRDVLFDKEIKKALSEETVYLRVDVDKAQQMTRLYNVRGYPTTYLLDPAGNGIASIPGYKPKNDFKKILAFLKGRHYKKMSLRTFMSS